MAMAMEQPEQHGWTTYLGLTSGQESLPQLAPSASAAALTDSNDSSLRQLRHRVIDPVVSGVLAPDEIGAVLVYRHLDQPEIRARITATNGEVSDHFLWPDPILPDDLSDIARQFASELEDFVAESRFGWGQQRTARFAIAEPFVPPLYRNYLNEPHTTNIPVVGTDLVQFDQPSEDPQHQTAAG